MELSAQFWAIFTNLTQARSKLIVRFLAVLRNLRPQSILKSLKLGKNEAIDKFLATLTDFRAERKEPCAYFLAIFASLSPERSAPFAWLSTILTNLKIERRELILLFFAMLTSLRPERSYIFERFLNERSTLERALSRIMTLKNSELLTRFLA